MTYTTSGDHPVIHFVGKFRKSRRGEYSVEVRLSKEPDCIVALVPRLPGCGTQGDTFDEALANVREAIKAVLECHRDAGEPIPWLKRDMVPPRALFEEVRYVQLYVRPR